MKLRWFVSFVLFFAFSVSIFAQQTPKPANEILAEAYQQAAKENKNVFIIFHASWCGWCHKMDSCMNDKTCKDFFSDNYVIKHLVVDEMPGKKNLENPGAGKMLQKYNGENQGIPFWLIFDKNGNLLADSRMTTKNAKGEMQLQSIGCPTEKNEIAYFINVLKKTSSPNTEQLAAIEKRFSLNAIKQH